MSDAKELLTREIERLTADLAAAQAGRPGDRLLIANIADRLTVRVDDGKVVVGVRGDDGRRRFIVRDGKAIDLSPSDLAAEIIRENPTAFGAEGKPAAGAEAEGARDGGFIGLTKKMVDANESKASESSKPLTDAERHAMRAANPWAATTKNLTHQMGIAKRDPAFAASLQRAAGVAD